MTTILRQSISIVLLSFVHSIALADPMLKSSLKIESEQAINLRHSYLIKYPSKTLVHFTGYIAVRPSLWYDDSQLTKRALGLLKQHSDNARSL